MYPNKTISRCQSLAKNKEFICNDCKWARNKDEHRIYCNKRDFDCNGWQTAPVHWCLDFELKDIVSTESPNEVEAEG